MFSGPDHTYSHGRTTHRRLLHPEALKFTDLLDAAKLAVGMPGDRDYQEGWRYVSGSGNRADCPVSELACPAFHTNHRLGIKVKPNGSLFCLTNFGATFTSTWVRLNDETRQLLEEYMPVNLHYSLEVIARDDGSILVTANDSSYIARPWVALLPAPAGSLVGLMDGNDIATLAEHDLRSRKVQSFILDNGTVDIEGAEAAGIPIIRMPAWKR